MNYTLIIISTLLVSAFFRNPEIAYLSANKFQIELDNKQGSLAARILSYFIKSPSRFIITILVGINLALVLYGNNMAEVLEPFFKNIIPAKYAGEITILLLQTLRHSSCWLQANLSLKYYSASIPIKRSMCLLTLSLLFMFYYFLLYG